MLDWIVGLEERLKSDSQQPGWFDVVGPQQTRCNMFVILLHT